MRRITVTTAVIFLTLGVLAIAWQLRAVVLVFIISLAIGATLDGPIERFAGWGLSRRWAILAVYLCAIVFLALMVVIAIPIVGETNLLVIDLAEAYNRLRFYLSSLTGTRVDLISAVMPTDEQFSGGVEQGALAPMLRQAVGITQDLGVIAGQFLLALVLSVYWTADRTRFERLWLSLLAPGQRAQTRIVLQRLTTRVGAYIRSEILQMFMAGALLTLGFWISGFKYPFTAAMLAALAWLIPLVGGLIALAPVLLIGWMSGPVVMGTGALYTVCVLLIMEMLVERRLFRGQRYWGVLVIFVMLALGSEFGVVGLIIAPPVAVALQVVLDALLAPSLQVTPPVEMGPEDIHALKSRLAQIEAEMAADADARTPRLMSLAARIRTLLAESEAVYLSAHERASDVGSESGSDTGSAAVADVRTGSAVRTTQ